MSLREAAQQALEALEDHAKQYPHMQKGYTVDAITALRTALAEPDRKPLTDEEIDAVCAPLGFAQLSPREVARAIERAHGIGGEA